MLLLFALISASFSSGSREEAKIDGKSRITEVRTLDEHGHEEIAWTKSDTRIDLLVDGNAYGTPRYHFVLKQDFWMKWNDGTDGSSSKLTLSRLDRTARGYDSIAWTKIVYGQDASFFDGMLQTRIYGCCGEEDTYRYLNPASGKLLATISARPLELHGANHGLYLGYLPVFSKRRGLSDTANLGGKLTLFSFDSIHAELVVVPQAKTNWSPILRDFGDMIQLDFLEEDERITLDVEVTKERKLRILPAKPLPAGK